MTQLATGISSALIFFVVFSTALLGIFQSKSTSWAKAGSAVLAFIVGAIHVFDRHYAALWLAAIALAIVAYGTAVDSRGVKGCACFGDLSDKLRPIKSHVRVFLVALAAFNLVTFFGLPQLPVDAAQEVVAVKLATLIAAGLYCAITLYIPTRTVLDRAPLGYAARNAPSKGGPNGGISVESTIAQDDPLIDLLRLESEAVLLFTSKQCQSCMKLLNRLEAFPAQAFEDRHIIVVAADDAEASMANAPGLYQKGSFKYVHDIGGEIAKRFSIHPRSPVPTAIIIAASEKNRAWARIEGAIPTFIKVFGLDDFIVFRREPSKA